MAADGTDGEGSIFMIYIYIYKILDYKSGGNGSDGPYTLNPGSSDAGWQVVLR